jgi:hypothetical protein
LVAGVDILIGAGDRAEVFIDCAEVVVGLQPCYFGLCRSCADCADAEYDCSEEFCFHGSKCKHFSDILLVAGSRKNQSGREIKKSHHPRGVMTFYAVANSY